MYMYIHVHVVMYLYLHGINMSVPFSDTYVPFCPILSTVQVGRIPDVDMDGPHSWSQNHN